MAALCRHEAAALPGHTVAAFPAEAVRTAAEGAEEVRMEAEPAEEEAAVARMEAEVPVLADPAVALLPAVVRAAEGIAKPPERLLASGSIGDFGRYNLELSTRQGRVWCDC